MIVTHLPRLHEVKTLESERLTVHVRTEQEYAADFAALDAATLKVCYGLSDTELAVQREKIAGGLSTYRTAVVFFLIALKESGEVIANCAFHNWYPMHRRSEIGYAVTDDAHKNKGYMKEVLPLILQYGFEVMELNRIEATIGPGNVASQRLVLGAGFVQEAVLKEHYCSEGVIGDSLVFRLLCSG